MSESKDLEWFFFCSPDRKYTTGSRRNRVTKNGFWKVTGNYKNISCGSRVVGKRKTLVFHEGKAPKGDRTNWVMHEYWLEDKKLAEADASICQDRFVVCKIFEKSGLGPKNGEQYGAPFEEEADDDSDGDGGDDVSGSLMPHPVAIPRSSSLLLGEGQDASMISSAVDSGDGRNSFPHYFEAPNVSAQHPSLEHDVHSLLLNVPDEDGDTSNGNNVQQADSICLNKTTVEDVEIFNGLEDLESIKKYLEDENVWHQTSSRFSEGSFLEMNDLLMPIEVEDYLEWNDLLPIEAFVSDPGISANVGPHSSPVLAAPKVMDGSSECNLGCMEATSDSACLHKKEEIRGLHANHSLARGIAHDPLFHFYTADRGWK